MAGFSEDYTSFQAELLPTGSVSFGRFELESLSWERRSSFSHNRFLEEVEKYSTPGSVSQKRAILEAHFRKKPLQPQASLDFSAADCQTTENGRDQHASCSVEFEHNSDNGREPEFTWYNDTPTNSVEHEEMECEQEETQPAEFPNESMSCDDEREIKPNHELSGHEQIFQCQQENDSMASSKDELCMVAEQEPDNKAVIVEELVENKEAVLAEQLLENKETILVEELKRDAPSKSPAVEKERVPTSRKKTQKAPVKGKEAVEQKRATTKRINQSPVQQNLRKSSTEKSYVSSSKMLSRSTGKLENESTPRTRSVKQFPSRTPMTVSSDSQSLKLEASVNTKTKVRQGSRRYEVTNEKDARTKKTSITPRSSSAKSEMDVRRPASRSRVADSTKEEMKQSGSIFSFKSDERAEKRKEYYMKLEEKLHAKKVEMNEIQARTQEETEAAIKQFRRSLNFKATPMPSFYHETTTPRASERKKKLGTPAKPQTQSKCTTTPGSRTFPREKSPSLPKPSNRERPSSSSGQPPSASKPPNHERPSSSSGPKKDERSKIGGNRARGGGIRSMMKGSIVGGSVAVHVAS